MQKNKNYKKLILSLIILPLGGFLGGIYFMLYVNNMLSNTSWTILTLAICCLCLGLTESFLFETDYDENDDTKKEA